MKTIPRRWCGWWLALLTAAGAVTVHADNPCIENPSTNSLTCVQSGTWTTNYVLAPTNINVGVGQFIAPPTISGLNITNGLEKYYVTYICTPSQSGWVTNNINYSIGSLGFTPAFPQILWTPGSYSYASKVVAVGSPCSPLTNMLGPVTINVASNNPDVLIDVDFGGGGQGGKTGYAAIGDSAADVWNYYSQTNVSSGALSNLVTADGGISPVGMLETGLPTAGTNGSPDAMYNDYLSTNGGMGTVTFTNLPSGIWNVYLYADDGNFGLIIQDTNNNVIQQYDPQICYDQTLSALSWEPGVQFVEFTNVTVGSGQVLTVIASPGINGVAMISGLQIASLSHTPGPLLLTSASSVVAWGNNTYGQTNVPTGLTNVVAIAAGGNASLALKNDGTLAAWGYGGFGQTTIPAGLANVMAIASGYNFCLALKSVGTVVAWGNNANGQINVPTGLSNVVAIAAGYYHSLALKSNGTVVAWGYNGYGASSVPTGLSNVVAIAAGMYHSLALKNDGTMVAWGNNTFGQTTVPTGLSNVVAIAAGGYYDIALKSDGTVLAWGNNSSGQTNVPTGLSNVVAITAGFIHSLALKSNGTVVAWGNNGNGQSSVPTGLSNVVAIAAGMYHSLALQTPAIPSGEIPYIYKPGAPGQVNVSLDSDYDGVSDMQELADRTDPNNPNSVPQIRLGYWPFDNTNTWVGDAGQLPLLASNVIGVPSWDTNAVLIDSTNPAVLSYRDVETNGNANINLRNGTIVLWFKPDWNSTNAGGVGPQSEARLIELGTQNTADGMWALIIGSAGTNINFSTQTNATGTLTTNLSASISWTSNVWHQIILTYVSTNSSLYIDGQPIITNGQGVVVYPSLAVRSHGFTIGSSASGFNQAKGAFDELETFNYALTNATAFDSNGNGLPDWWECKYFGTLNLSATNQDAHGNTLLSDYQNGTDPNVILFTLSVTNLYFNQTSVPVQINLQGGTPDYYAVLVNDTNYSAATWLPYTGTNIVVNLDFNEGWHDVWVGLRGLPSDAQQTWQIQQLKMDMTPPQLMITNPVLVGSSGTVISVPMIQLQGYSLKTLSSISYDLSNAVAVVTNQQVLVMDRNYDTNVFEFTTNTFQGFDIGLTNGDNTFTIHATDLAGNVSTTNFILTLNYLAKTNPTTAQIIWPQNNTPIAGTNFTLRGWMDDFTATVTASLVDTNGVTNTFNGLVERNGNFWLEDLPLDGTNTYTLTISDASGMFIITTNITVNQSIESITLDSPTGDLWQPTTSVSGTIPDSSYSICINGVIVTNDYWTDGETWHWDADNVPVNQGGVATFSMTVTDSSSNRTVQEADVDKQPRLYVENYHADQNEFDHELEIYRDRDWTIGTSNDITVVRTLGHLDWHDGSGGGADDDETFTQHYLYRIDWPGLDYYDSEVYTTTHTATTWSNSFWPDLPDGVSMLSGNHLNSYSINAGPVPIVKEQCNVAYHLPEPIYTEKDISKYHTIELNGTFSRNAQATIKLITGGKETVQKKSLFGFNGSAQDMMIGGTVARLPFAGSGGSWPGGVPIPAQNITINGMAFGSDGKLWVALPDSSQPIDVTPQLSGKTWFTFDLTQQKYKLHILANGNPLSEDHVRRGAYFCVGQKLNFQAVFSPGVPDLNYTSPIWNYTADYINNHWTDANGCEEYNIAPIPAMSNPTTAWFYNKQTQDATANLGLYCKFDNGQSVYLVRQGEFNVFTPSIQFYPPSGNDVVEVRHGTGINLGATLLGIGDGVQNDAMEFSAMIKTIYNFPGQAITTQLINRQASADTILSFGTGGASDLDNGEIYSKVSLTNNPSFPNWNPQNQIIFFDQPGIGISLYAWASCNDHFHTYIRFKPDGDADNIYVTLGRANWDWHGKADYIGGFPPNPYPLSNWQVSGTGTGGPDFSPVNDFPIWPAVYYNSLF